jgi:hypothetical protein
VTPHQRAFGPRREHAGRGRRAANRRGKWAREVYDDLADTLEAAAEAARRRAPAARLRALAAAYREWALAHPHRYRLVFSSTYGSGRLAPERTIPAAHRSMVTFLEAIAALSPASGAAAGPRTALHRELVRWAGSRGGDGGGHMPASALHLGIVAWTRLHGVVSLEIEGSFAPMGVDPALLYASEVDQLVAQAEAAA